MSNPTFVRNPSQAQREQLRAELTQNLADTYGADVATVRRAVAAIAATDPHDRPAHAVAVAAQLPHTNHDPELAAWLADELVAAAGR